MKLAVIEGVWKNYGKKTGANLSAITHQKGTPWSKTWEYSHFAKIPDDLIQRYYQKLLHDQKEIPKSEIENFNSVQEKISEVANDTSLQTADTISEDVENLLLLETQEILEGKVEEEREKLKTKRFEQENKEFEDLHKLRQDNLPKIRKVVFSWLIIVAIFTFLAGFRISSPNSFSFNSDSCETCIKIGFNLSEGVLIAFITSTTASVIGLFLIAAKWLFPAKDK